jgi:hypothetical protein
VIQESNKTTKGGNTNNSGCPEEICFEKAQERHKHQMKKVGIALDILPVIPDDPIALQQVSCIAKGNVRIIVKEVPVQI